MEKIITEASKLSYLVIWEVRNLSLTLINSEIKSLWPLVQSPRQKSQKINNFHEGKWMRMHPFTL